MQQNKRPLELEGRVTHAQPGEDASSSYGGPLPAVQQGRFWGLLHSGPGPYCACCPVSACSVSSLQKCLLLTYRERLDQIEIISMQNEKPQGTGFFFNQRTARRSQQSILKEVNPEYLLKGLMLKGFPSVSMMKNLLAMQELQETRV